MSALLLVGHGSPDERSAVALRALAARVRAHRPEQPTELAFLETSTPTIPDAAARLPRTAPLIVVPLLLATGFHTEIDLPEQLRQLPQSQIRVAPPLGPDPLLDAAVRRRLVEIGAAPRPAACAVVTGSARQTRDELLRAVSAARDGGATRVVIAAHLLAPGRFHDLLCAVGADAVTEPLAGTPEMVQLVLHRAGHVSAELFSPAVRRR